MITARAITAAPHHPPVDHLPPSVTTGISRTIADDVHHLSQSLAVLILPTVNIHGIVIVLSTDLGPVIEQPLTVSATHHRPLQRTWFVAGSETALLLSLVEGIGIGVAATTATGVLHQTLGIAITQQDPTVRIILLQQKESPRTTVDTTNPIAAANPILTTSTPGAAGVDREKMAEIAPASPLPPIPHRRATRVQSETTVDVPPAVSAIRTAAGKSTWRRSVTVATTAAPQTLDVPKSWGGDDVPSSTPILGSLLRIRDTGPSLRATCATATASATPAETIVVLRLPAITPRLRRT